MNRYRNSFFITTLIYLFSTFFLFFLFADEKIVEKPQETKISLNYIKVEPQKPVVAQAKPMEEIKPIEKIIEKPVEKIVKKPLDKPIKKVHHKKNRPHKMVKKEHHKQFRKVHKEIKSIEKNIVQPQQKIVTNIPKQNIENKVISNINHQEIKDLESQYLSKVRSLIEENKIYPKTAKRLNQTGKVFVSFVITKDGKIKDIKIVKSSDFERLNEAATEILSQIGKFEAIPEKLKKEEFEITIPISYELT